MCHVVLLMPLLALPMFWLLPLDVAGPSYAGIVAVSGWLYYYVLKAMHRPVETGREPLLRATGEVLASRPYGHYLVRVKGETWSARSPDALAAGDPIAVTDVDGVVLEVVRAGKT